MSAASSGTVAAVQDTGSQQVVQQPMLSSVSVLPGSASSAAVKVTEVPVTGGKNSGRFSVPRRTCRCCNRRSILLPFASRSAFDRERHHRSRRFREHHRRPRFRRHAATGLSSQLEQSPFLNLLSDQHVAQTLALMARPKTPAHARVGPRGLPTHRECCRYRWVDH